MAKKVWTVPLTKVDRRCYKVAVSVVAETAEEAVRRVHDRIEADSRWAANLGWRETDARLSVCPPAHDGGEVRAVGLATKYGGCDLPADTEPEYSR